MKAVPLPGFSALGLVPVRASRQQRPLLRTAQARPCAPCQSCSTPDSAVGIPTPPEPTASCPAVCSSSGQDSSEPSGSASPRAAWNKGHTMPAATRRKLSQALKQRWKDPERRAAATAKLKGIEPWNKGRTLSEETRAKMRAAKLGRTVSKATRRRMSAAHRGKTHSQETVDLLSDMALGRAKTQEHKALIASGQRRRHAAARVLRAVESVYEAQAVQGVQDSCSGGGAGGGSVSAFVSAATGTKPAAPVVAQPGSVSNGARGPAAAGEVAAAASIQTARLAAYRNAAGGVAAAGGSAAAKPRKLSMAQILGEYKAELREYRALQEELSPWSTAFLEKHGRKPGMQDVVATGIPWLMMRYKQYIVLRDRLFTDTGSLRQRLHSAIPDSENGVGSINRAGALSMGAAGTQQSLAGPGAVNANGAAGARGSAANRFSAAMEYKAARGRSSPVAGSSSVGGSMAPAAVAQQAPQRQGAGEAAAQAKDAAGAASTLDPLGAPLPEEMSGDEEDLQDDLPGPNVPPRVRLAMMAAQEYRKKKAQATKALAAAAAAAAKAGPAGAAKAAAAVAVAASSAPAGEAGEAATRGRAGA